MRVPDVWCSVHVVIILQACMYTIIIVYRYYDVTYRGYVGIDGYVICIYLGINNIGNIK